MSERDDLLVSVAHTIKTYRKDDLPEPTPEHVDRWLNQFTPAQQLPFLREFAHVIEKSFCTQQNIEGFLRLLVTNAGLVGGDPTAYWSSANFLNIQQNGQSQREMLKLFATCLREVCGVELSGCGQLGGDYIYLDDVMFSGNRVGNDLEAWINYQAPQSAKVHVIVAAWYSGGYYQARKKLEQVVQKSGKQIAIKYWRAVEFENRKWFKNTSAVLWPSTIPDAEAVHAYLAIPSRFPHEPRQPGLAAIDPFSSEAGRQILESEFLIAGAKIRAMSENPKQSMRPLGYSSFGVGFGALITTYRNCPNNCPLAMWWGDPEATSGALHWYPLLLRDGYSSAKNIFNGLPAL